MEAYRIFVEKRPGFRVEAQSLLSELNESLSTDLKSLRIVGVYDLFGFSPELLERCRYTVFGEVVTDVVTDSCSLSGCKYIAVEYLPGQFDQRAASARDCVRLIEPSAEVSIRSSRLLIFDGDVPDDVLDRIRHYYINPVESRPKDLSRLAEPGQAEVRPVPVLDGLRDLTEEELEPYCKKMGLAMSADDLREVVSYFKGEGRDPSETELRILDTYWSDHCRHTTFNTELDSVEFEDSFVREEMEGTYRMYLGMRGELGREDRSVCLMDVATIGARWLRSHGMLDDLEESEENNACSIRVDVDVDGKTQEWLLQFKNETHNHPTEIEPFGGAATCLGGAIRDPLSGRSYVYQAMRVTGAGDIYAPVSETLPGKLPQRVISRKAAQGYSSYGNQVGLATTHVREIYHPGYTAKRMEIGAVVGAVAADRVRRESPVPGDVVLLVGGRTGRDGIGGATGSSKEHDESSLETCGSEVQKGNAPEERKLQRLLRRPEVTRLIKKANDFGAGGVSVAIGELADGLDIYLDRIPVKYSGLNSTEIAISESQERMAVVVSASDKEAFERFCSEENVEVTHVADVTGSARMRMYNKGAVAADLSRAFIDSAGARRHATVRVSAVEDRDPFRRDIPGDSLADKLEADLSDDNVVSQKGLIEMFDSTIGRSTVLLPFGGVTQTTETQVSVQKLPTDGYTDTASVMAWGFNPYLSEWSPYHGAAYAVVDACAKAVACGASWKRMRFSFQEYFEKMTSDPHSWGKPMAALLGGLRMQAELGLPSIGGKDSMSGTFGHINVPPTLVAFGVTTVKASSVISPELKWEGDLLYLVRHRPLGSRMPDSAALGRNWDFVHDHIASGEIVAAYAVGYGGVAEALCKMSFGNSFGVDVNISEEQLFDWSYGSIVVESMTELHGEDIVPLGKVTSGEDGMMRFNGEPVSISRLLEAVTRKFARIYPDVTPDSSAATSLGGSDRPSVRRHSPATALSAQTRSSAAFFDGIRPRKMPARQLLYGGPAIERPVVFIPVFPGTNCDYDSAKAWRKAGADVRFGVFRNLDSEDILASIDETADAIDGCNVLMLAGGFSAGDEPDGSGKFIANVLCNAKVSSAIGRLLDRQGLILGICNGFQALVKSGLLPFGKPGQTGVDSPTLFRNDINRHVSRMVTTRVSSVNSPWLSGFKIGDTHTIAVSHGEGKFVVGEDLARKLFAAGQVAFQYADPLTDAPTMASPANPNGSCWAIEGVISPDGRILGKMGHSERYERGTFKNIGEDNLEQPLFDNAVRYFRHGKGSL